jgi:hypothetical protein
MIKKPLNFIAVEAGRQPILDVVGFFHRLFITLYFAEVDNG